MRLLSPRFLVVATSVLVLGASSALAQVNVDLAFNPDTASPGDRVTLSAAVDNLGNAPVVADFAVSIAVGQLSLGPFHYPAPLPAEFHRSIEIPFVVPRLPRGGTLRVTVTAKAGESSDTATATLTIVTSAVTAADEPALRHFATTIGTAMAAGSGPTSTSSVSVSEVKKLYR